MGELLTNLLSAVLGEKLFSSRNPKDPVRKEEKKQNPKPPFFPEDINGNLRIISRFDLP